MCRFLDAGNNETLGALSEHASKKRQGTKSREMYRERYGDLNEVRGLGKLDWIAQAERWHELARAQNSWRFQEKPLQQSMHPGPIATQTECE